MDELETIEDNRVKILYIDDDIVELQYFQLKFKNDEINDALQDKMITNFFIKPANKNLLYNEICNSFLQTM